MNKKYKVDGLDDYEIDYWIEELGSPPTRVVQKEDYSDGYDIDQMYVLEHKRDH